MRARGLVGVGGLVDGHHYLLLHPEGRVMLLTACASERSRLQPVARMSCLRSCWWMSACWPALSVLAAGGFEVHLLGKGGQEAGLPFGLAGQGRGGALRWEVED